MTTDSEPTTEYVNGPAFRCPFCLAKGTWRLQRQGDAAVSWACDADLTNVIRNMQRDEHTQVMVRLNVPLRRWCDEHDQWPCPICAPVGGGQCDNE